MDLVRLIGELDDPLKSSLALATASPEGCLSALRNDVIMAELQATDFIVGDIVYTCGSFAPLVVAKPFLLYSPAGTLPGFWDIGPAPSGSVPVVGSKLSDEMSMLQLIGNFLLGLVLEGFLVSKMRWPACELLFNHFDATPTVTTFSECDAAFTSGLGKTGINLLLTDPSFEFPRPLDSSAHFVGHPLSRRAAPLRHRALTAFMEEAPVGVVLVSFGTLTTLDQTRLETLAAAFTELSRVRKISFLWKLPSGADSESIHFDHEYTMVTDWLPQNDVLGHAKTLAFVTHGGRNSLEEAAYHGTPVVCMPILGDQFDNCVRPESRGFGVTLDQDSLTPPLVVAAISAALAPEMQVSATLVSTRINSHAAPPVERIGDWVEFGLATGGSPHLNPKNKHSSMGSTGSILVAFFAVGLLGRAFGFFGFFSPREAY
jgi:glucuronosyltransferase